MSATKPLEGFKVIEPDLHIAGPFTAKMFAEFGAHTEEVLHAHGYVAATIAELRQRKVI